MSIPINLNDRDDLEIDGFNRGKLFFGKVNSNGTIGDAFPEDWICERVDFGFYRITHNLGGKYISMVQIDGEGQSPSIIATTQDFDNHFTVSLVRINDDSVDFKFKFILII